MCSSPSGGLFHAALEGFFFSDARFGGVFADVFGELHRASAFAQASADKEVRFGACREARRGTVFASRTSCPTLRIFSSNGSRASFCRISGFIALAVSVYLPRCLSSIRQTSSGSNLSIYGLWFQTMAYSRV